MKKAIVACPGNCIECEWHVESCPEDAIKIGKQEHDGLSKICSSCLEN